MAVTFGICAGPNGNIDYLKNLIYSIEDQELTAGDFHFNDYEIIVCGNVDPINQIEGVTYLPFDENIKPGWITRKKNLITQSAKHDNIVLIHDYYMLDELWWKGFQYYNFKNPNWQILMNTVWTFEGTRSPDWLVNQKYMDKVLEKYPALAEKLVDIAPNENGPRWVCGLAYETNDLNHIQYVAGGYIVAKKSVFLDCPLDENLKWGDGEDIAWSEKLIEKGYKFDFNPFCSVFIQKPNKWHLHQMSEECEKRLREMYGNKEKTNDVLKVRDLGNRPI